MYTQEQREKAVEMFLETGSYSAVVNALGYGSRWSIERWVGDYNSQGFVKESRSKWFKFTEEQKGAAVRHFLDNGCNVSETVRTLGYPSRTLLSLWIDELAPEARKPRKDRVEYSLEQKIDAVVSLCDKDKPVAYAVSDTGADKVTLYSWRQQLLGKDAGDIVEDIGKGRPHGCEEDLREEIKALRRERDIVERELYLARLELAVRQGAVELVKKDPGADLKNLTNRERTILVDALRMAFPLNDLLGALRLPKSSYYYQREAMARGDKYARLRQDIRQAFEDNKECYGYRRIHSIITRDGSVTSEKVVIRLMAEEGLCVKTKRRRKYSSYAGEISPEVPNLLKRDFCADAPNEKWLTDLTEFHIPAGKAYLSPVIDCFDGMAVSWEIGTSPNAELVNTMLDEATDKLKDGECPILHHDRGCHYRWPGWLSRIKEAGLVNSMSKKGCSPDNSACEGFFGRLKNEFFYNRSWQGVSIDGFIAELDAYLHWYNDKRIKQSLGYLSPAEHRQSLGLAA